ncbi:uncharacterized protein LOC129264910 [Lytechinus pictus]|uniref:uncharacterized protein LOC129264910 n=1 Tax=Lytechinus pictus TaxID=7653 RepID=UPI0030BA071D
MKLFCSICVAFILQSIKSCHGIDCESLPIPKSYIVYALKNGEKINIDGRLDDNAWKEVTRSDTFIDIQGEKFPKPRFDTWVKMRWDYKYLYIGAYLQEKDVFANQTKHDSVVFKDNDFEVFTDPDGSTHWYKEFEINAINTTWDLILNKPYLNGGFANSSFEMTGLQSAIFVNGPINDPLHEDKYWTVELALPLHSLVTDDSEAKAPPKHGDQWRINFSRVEWHVKNVDGHYEKVPGLQEDNWVWSSQDAINMHLPERWGFIQFSSDAVNQTKFVRDPRWPIYTSLIAVYNAEKEFFSVRGYFTEDINQLEIPDYIRNGTCAQPPNITVLQNYKFTATVQPLTKGLKTGHIRDDRLIWFTP